MNTDLREMLTDRAESVDIPRFDALAIQDRGQRLARRRRGLTAASAALAVAITAVATTAILDSSRDRAAPDPAAPTLRVDQPTASGARPLSYGQGQTLHVGDRTTDTGLDMLSLDVTDDGAVVTTLDGGIWFTDGSRLDKIGVTIGGEPFKDGVNWPSATRPHDWVATDNHGSLLAWLEFPNGDLNQPELVVYDTSRPSEIAREPVDPEVLEPVQVVKAPHVVVVGRTIFLTQGYDSTIDATAVLQYEVDSGTFALVGSGAYETARRNPPRSILVGRTAARARPLDDRLFGFAVRDSRLVGLFDVTGLALDIKVPTEYEPAKLWFGQWLDNDRFTLISSNGHEMGGAPAGDLLVCRIAVGRCTVRIPAEEWTTPPLLPGDGGVGAELAQIAAARAALR